jgi:hypothetical protein
VAAVTGTAAGLFASWTVLLLRTAWHGTPFPAEGVYGDTGRLAAMATRYTVTSASAPTASSPVFRPNIRRCIHG